MTRKNKFEPNEFPDFLIGTFNWQLSGFQFTAKPSVNLLSSDSLSSDNPWIVVAAVLACAIAGDHSQVFRLEPLFHAKEPWLIDRVSISLVGDIGTKKQLLLLENALRLTDDSVRRYAAQAASFACHLPLVPGMVDAWKNARSLDEHEIIGYAVSELLEPTLGSIADEASIYRLPANPPKDATPLLTEYWLNRVAEDLTIERFPESVSHAYQTINEQLDSEQVAVRHGAVFDVAQFAHEFLGVIQSDEPFGLLSYRHRFEAVTGIDCSDFFVDAEPQRLLIQATIEEFLQSDPRSRFEPGVRYFFGHRIPD